jgi:tungstate transport system ATP-binding protein
MPSPLSDLPLRFEAVTHRAGAHRLVEAVDLVIERGSPTVLLGPNGSGKTTMIRLAADLQAPSAGHVSWGGRGATDGSRLAVVLQRPVMLRRSAAANVAYALHAAGRAAGHQAVALLLERVGLAHVASRPARRLSGGEQQRLALARALAREPEILFLDEPTANLDPSATRGVEEIIAGAVSSGVKIVMATHDLGQARRLAGDVVFLARGRVVERAPAQSFFSSPATADAASFLRGDLVI